MGEERCTSNPFPLTVLNIGQLAPSRRIFTCEALDGSSVSNKRPKVQLLALFENSWWIREKEEKSLFWLARVSQWANCHGLLVTLIVQSLREPLSGHASKICLYKQWSVRVLLSSSTILRLRSDRVCAFHQGSSSSPLPLPSMRSAFTGLHLK